MRIFLKLLISPFSEESIISNPEYKTDLADDVPFKVVKDRQKMKKGNNFLLKIIISSGLEKIMDPDPEQV